MASRHTLCPLSYRAIQGLLSELPPLDKPWPQEDQDAWIDGWKVALRFLYKTGRDSKEARPARSANDGGGESD